MTLSLNPIWPLPLVVATAVALLLLVLTTYPPRVRHLSPSWRRALLGLRLATAAVLIVAMLRPELQQRESDDDRRVVLILADASRSMQTRDVAGSQSRRESLTTTLVDVQGLLDELREKVDVRFMDFSQSALPVEQVAATAEGTQTAIGAVLDTALQSTERQQLAAMLLLSDGAQRAVSPYDADPRQVAQRIAQHPTHRVPISTIAFGSATLEGAMDLAVEELAVAGEMFVKTTVPVTGRLRVTGAAGRELTVRLLLEDRTGKQPGETGELVELPVSSTARPVQQIGIRSNNEVVNYDLSFIPPQAGEFKLAVLVEPIEGELKTNNNQRATIVSVSKGGLKIAYFDKVYWEQKYIRLAGQSKKIDIDFVPVRPQPFGSRTQIEPALFTRTGAEAYDAFIIGDVPREVFGDENLKNLAARVREGAGLLMLGGFHTLGPGGYAGSPLEPLLPVDLRGDTANAHHLTDLPMLPTREGLSHFVMRLEAVGENIEQWQQLPPLQSGNRLVEKNAAVEVLAATDPTYPRAGVPLLFAHDVGGARVMAFAGDTTWQWVLNGQAEAHQRFWRQMLLYLTHKELDTDRPVWAIARPRTVFPQQGVEVEFGARNAEGQPLPEANFDVSVLAPEQPVQAATPRRDGDRHTAEFRETANSGDYWVRVAATHDGRSVGPDAWTRFVVESRDLELDNPAANPDLLRELAQTTGGRFLKPEELRGYLQDLLDNPPQSLVERLQRTRLWDNWWFLLLFVSLLSTEWLLRKRRGLV